MNYSFTEIFVLFALVMLVSGLTGATVHHSVDMFWRDECVKRNVAGYNSVTGNWEWLVEVVDREAETEIQVKQAKQNIPALPAPQTVTTAMQSKKIESNKTTNAEEE